MAQGNAQVGPAWPVSGPAASKPGRVKTRPAFKWAAIPAKRFSSTGTLWAARVTWLYLLALTIVTGAATVGVWENSRFIGVVVIWPVVNPEIEPRVDMLKDIVSSISVA